MTNKEIAARFALLGKLTELHDDNAFRARSYANAAFRIKKLDRPLADMDAGAIAGLPGFGAALQAKTAELIETGTMAKLEELLVRTPAGILDILGIKGLGAKKVAVIWRELGVETPGELLYACRENRLALLKGFGAKTQQSVIEAIEFWQRQAGLHHWASLEAPAEALRGALAGRAPRVEDSGAFRRRAVVLERAELLAEAPEGVSPEAFAGGLTELEAWTDVTVEGAVARGLVDGRWPAEVRAVTGEAFARTWFEATASEAHAAALPDALDPGAGDEAAIYASAGLAWIAPELREGRLDEVALAREGRLPRLLETADIRGVVHSHSTWSDGGATVEAMARRAIERGYDYLVMSDHSRTAVYAGGLSIDRVRAQWDEIDALNERLAPFRIYRAIESDILADGSLDYPEEILAGFDLVIASIHSGLKMDEARATERLLAAIRNPFTTILGHPTGRLLLSRPGYPVDHEAVIAACAEHGVVLELNANPWRLDLDWTWIPAAVAAGVPVSVNPDAHALGGIDDIRYGVLAARKGGLTAEGCWNARSREGVDAWLAARRERAGA